MVTDSRHTRYDSLAGRSRNDALCLIALFAAVLVCWMPRLKGPLDFRWDAGVYYVLGTSLAEGKGYRLLNEPGEIQADQYPPLLPAIIAAHQLLLGTNDHVVVGQWLRITYFLIFIIYILTVYLMARSYLPPRCAFLVALVCLLSLHTYFLSDLCFPEIPFALVTTLFVLCARNGARSPYGVLSALLVVVAYALRTAGIALLAAWVGESVFKRDFTRAALRSAVSAVAVLVWVLYISTVESGERYKSPAYEYQRAAYLFHNVSYVRNVFLLKEPFAPEMGPPSLTDITARFLHNLQVLPLSMGEVVTSKRKLWEAEWTALNTVSPLHLDAPWAVDIALLALGCLILGGVAIQLARRQWIIPLYILCSLAALCLTPWPQQFPRYLAPLAPFLALSLCIMLLRLLRPSRDFLPIRWRVGLVVAVVLVVFLQQAVTVSVVYSKSHQRAVYGGRNGEEVAYRLFFYNPAQGAFDAGIDWLKSRAKPDEVVASSMPHWVYLRTGLKSVMPSFELDPAQAQRLLDSVPVSYMLVEDGLALDTTKYTFSVAQAFPDRWRRIYSDSFPTGTDQELTGRFEIYQRVH